ncbi:hypothetical protein M2651_03635 [Clostridium sp. SYSU_GA19001]|uniref:hypothetical protein n=1 Tax=Clostridium caldaquaticum TaxID=2940653 RepID=UPI0020779A52|nr:hypothetical protein [Clostridium caldaquaticum]MCM8710120.1 hypothetical protein [Clostridium caldaquaticum]
MDKSIGFGNDVVWEDTILYEYSEENINQNSLNFYKIRNKPEEIVIENNTEGRITDSKFSFTLVKQAAIRFLKQNAVFLICISVIWILAGSQDYLIKLFNTPVIGKPLTRFALFIGSGATGNFLRYITATYNGPVFNMTVYTFFVAIAAKTVYLLAVTEVVFPAIKELFKDSAQAKKYYTNVWNLAKNNLLQGIYKKNTLGFLLVGAGSALALSNFLTRNGKFDKSFVLFLLSFVMLKGLGGSLPSVLDFLLCKVMRAMTFLMAGFNENSNSFYQIMRLGAIFGFLLAIIVGNFGEFFGYNAGIVIMIVGVVINFINKGSLKHDN